MFGFRPYSKEEIFDFFIYDIYFDQIKTVTHFHILKKGFSPSLWPSSLFEFSISINKTTPPTLA